MTMTPLRDLLATSVSIVLLFVAPCLGQAGSPRGQPAWSARQDFTVKIDRYIKAEMRQQQIPGLSLAVIRKGKIALVKTYGLSNVEHQVPVKPETVF